MDLSFTNQTGNSDPALATYSDMLINRAIPPPPVATAKALVLGAVGSDNPADVRLRRRACHAAHAVSDSPCVPPCQQPAPLDPPAASPTPAAPRRAVPLRSFYIWGAVAVAAATAVAAAAVGVAVARRRRRRVCPEEVVELCPAKKIPSTAVAEETVGSEEGC